MSDRRRTKEFGGLRLLSPPPLAATPRAQSRFSAANRLRCRRRVLLTSAHSEHHRRLLVSWALALAAEDTGGLLQELLGRQRTPRKPKMAEATTATGSQLRDRDSAVELRLVAAGVLLIFGGEAFCILGPHERIVHVSCHAALYAGMVLVAVGAVLYWARRLRGGRNSDKAGV